MVDEVVYLGLFLLKESYLWGELIIEKVKEFGVDVIYLGYGFFLENVEFVNFCVKNNIIFVGFLVFVIEVMGFKFVVKYIMEKVGVFLVLGYYGDD